MALLLPEGRSKEMLHMASDLVIKGPAEQEHAKLHIS